MRKKISTHVLWMALTLMLSTTALEAVEGREAARQPRSSLGVESLVVYLWDQMSTAAANGLELLAGHWASREAETEGSHTFGSTEGMSVGGALGASIERPAQHDSDLRTAQRAPAQVDPTLEMPTSEAGYPQIDPNG